MGDVYYNHGERPIYISASIRPDPLGGPGEMESMIIVKPGQGIDVSILGLKERPATPLIQDSEMGFFNDAGVVK